MMNGDKGPNGAIGICPKCGKHDGIVWHPETDTCDCICGWRSTPSFEVMVRVLECCLTADHSRCPYTDDWNCDHSKVQDALALLRKQRAEIERLKVQNAIYERGAEAAADIIEQLETCVFDSDKYIAEYDGSEVQKAYNKGLRDALEVAKNRGGGERCLKRI